MSLFRCSKCGCAEDTALCHYWGTRVRQTAPVCSACDPKIGKWHGEFPRELFELRHKTEVEDWLGMSLDFGGKPSPHASASPAPQGKDDDCGPAGIDKVKAQLQ